MGGASSFYAMLSLCGFFTCVWLSGKISMLLGVSSIVLEVGVGLVLGPGMAQLIPRGLSVCSDDRLTDCEGRQDQQDIALLDTEYCDLGAYLEKGKYAEPWYDGFWGRGTEGSGVVTLKGHAYNLSSAEGHRRLAGGGNAGKTKYDTYGDCLKESCGLRLALSCATVPDIFTLVGHAGVALMIFESGMHFDFDQAKVVGPWACLVALLGTLLPIAAGAGLSVAFGFPLMPDGLSVGVSLAPTSVGIALKLLHESHALETYFGQAVMTAAFVDDVLSLVLFSVLFAVGAGDPTFLSFLPLILGIVFMFLAIIAAVKVWPWLINFVLSKVKEDKADHKRTRHEEVLWILMFGCLLAYAMITHLCGTHLWGCFIAGMSFATQEQAARMWVRQVKRYTVWMLRIFFACTLAWAIPISDLFSLEAFWMGSVMGIGPCILTKVLCGPFMGDSRWVIGWAMVGRAEFAYFIGIMAKSLKMMDGKLFAILVWALLYATIFAPLIFRWVLQRYMKRKGLHGEAEAIPEGVPPGGEGPQGVVADGTASSTTGGPNRGPRKKTARVVFAEALDEKRTREKAQLEAMGGTAVQRVRKARSKTWSPDVESGKKIGSFPSDASMPGASSTETPGAGSASCRPPLDVGTGPDLGDSHPSAAAPAAAEKTSHIQRSKSEEHL